jgi:hypothetical protein
MRTQERVGLGFLAFQGCFSSVGGSLDYKDPPVPVHT